MKNITNIITCIKAKTKKSLGGIIGTVIAVVVVVTIFFDGAGAFIGVLFGAGILAAVAAGVYFW
ncbi:MAG: hypothetical protein ACTSQK_09520, partial [Candidatus Heimdallarchaeota archaeon]